MRPSKGVHSSVYKSMLVGELPGTKVSYVWFGHIVKGSGEGVVGLKEMWTWGVCGFLPLITQRGLKPLVCYLSFFLFGLVGKRLGFPVPGWCLYVLPAS